MVCCVRQVPVPCAPRNSKRFPDYFLTKTPPRRKETEATDFRFSILIFGEQAPIPRCPHDYRIFLLPYAGKGKGSRHRCVLRNSHIHDLSGVAEEQLEALVDAGCLEVVALSVASGLRAEVLLRQDAVEYCQ